VGSSLIYFGSQTQLVSSQGNPSPIRPTLDELESVRLEDNEEIAGWIGLNILVFEQGEEDVVDVNGEDGSQLRFDGIEDDFRRRRRRFSRYRTETPSFSIVAWRRVEDSLSRTQYVSSSLRVIRLSVVKEGSNICLLT
jgi:hypothetical protein